MPLSARYLVCVGALMLVGWAVPASAAPASAEAAIRAVEARQAQAWNAHDIHAYAALFTDNADVINVLGWWWKSRHELETKLGQAHLGPFKSSVLRIGQVKVTFPARDVAVAQVTWTMTGALTPDGNPSDVPQRGIQTQVLVRRDDVWKISAFQNTNSSPERPFAR
ncbi:MAG TPA: SgcJ/EcaC family oxidoreductase [Caulobacteraceae bacterium]